MLGLGPVVVSHRLKVNPIVCSAHGLCAELFPERVTLDDWGYPVIDGAPVDGDLAAHARRAVAAARSCAQARSSVDSLNRNSEPLA